MHTYMHIYMYSTYICKPRYICVLNGQTKCLQWVPNTDDNYIYDVNDSSNDGFDGDGDKEVIATAASARIA